MMAMSLRYVRPSLVKVVRRHCRVYSTQIDGLRLDQSPLSCPREELHHYQELVTDKVSAILEEGKRLANSVCVITGTHSCNPDHNDNAKDEIDFDHVASLINEANELRVQVTANAVVPYYHFYGSSVSVKDEQKTDLAAASMHHRPVIQSYTYAGDNCTVANVNQTPLNDLLKNGEVLDDAFGVDTVQNLPPHLLAYVRENTHSGRSASSKSKNIYQRSEDPAELFKQELQACQNQILNQALVYSSSNSPEVVKSEELSTKQPSSQQDNDSPKPTRDQLIKVHESMTLELPKILLKRHDYRQYRPDVVFENNFFNKSYTTKGIAQYVVEVAKMRVWAHFKYANVRMSLLKSTIEEDEGTVTFHWRMSGVPQMRAFMFWKFLPWTYRDTIRKESDYHEGISTLYVDNTGLIAKHQLDQTMVDKEYQTAEPRKSLVEKMRKLLSPKPAIGAAYKDGTKR